jgi:hypothetical protein
VLTENWLSSYTVLGAETKSQPIVVEGAPDAMDEAKESSHRKGKGTAPPDVGTETLNFKVTTEFKKEFKGYAVNQGITMLELLKEGFELSKQKRRE